MSAVVSQAFSDDESSKDAIVELEETIDNLRQERDYWRNLFYAEKAKNEDGMQSQLDVQSNCKSVSKKRSGKYRAKRPKTKSVTEQYNELQKYYKALRENTPVATRPSPIEQCIILQNYYDAQKESSLG